MRSGRGAGREHHLDLGDRGGVEAGAERGQQRQHLRRRVRLHGVEHAACPAAPWRRSGSCRARRRGRRRGTGLRPAVSRRLRRNSRMRSVIGALLTKAQRAATARLKFRRARTRPASAGEVGSRCRAMETRRTRRALHPTMLPWFGAGDPVPHGRQGWTSLFGVRPLEGRRDQKSPLRRCFKPRPPLRAGCAGFASGCRSECLGSQLRSPQAAVRPLVRMPTDRHTATGTCEIGQRRK